MTTALFILHGGAGHADQLPERRKRIDQSMTTIVQKTKTHASTHAALEVVQFAVELLEDCEEFNAGTGSCLQQDGKVRMSASIMESTQGKFGAVVNSENIQHPIALARYLMDQQDCVMDGYGSQILTKKLGIPNHDPITPFRRKQFLNFKSDSDTARHGTVGAVAVDSNGCLAAATSTGGKGFEIPGRVSDSCMPCSTYATPHVAISCTGVGEHIIRHSPAVHLAAWMATQPDHFDTHLSRLEQQASENHFEYGLIAITSTGRVGYFCTTQHITLGKT